MREGSLEAPTRHPLAWTSDDFYDEAKLDAEMRRVFDICHGCRRCFNLCDSFPRLFDLVDATDAGEVHGVDSADFGPVVEACTLCDMCFMTKCPYVPPHEWALDFPHLMLRHRAVQAKKNGIPFIDRQLAATDRNGVLAGMASSLVNWATDERNTATRGLMEGVAGIHHGARLPRYAGETLVNRARRETPVVNREAPAFGKRKVVLYATCYGNFNDTGIGAATRAVLARNGVESEVVHPACCGMPRLELGDIAAVAEAARNVSAAFAPWIDKGYDVVALTPSCALMLKFEWPLILPGDEPVKRLSKATYDIAEYIVDIARKDGLAPGLSKLEGGVSVHLACHARAQNVGPKAAELLRLIPDTPVSVIERCSGHGGVWGARSANFDVAVKVGKPAARQAVRNATPFVASECPMAGDHLAQVMATVAEDGGPPPPARAHHPVELFARAYGIDV
ncbi:MAG: glycerol-3-phosphate dehydrogenase [Rhodospirillales bacterium]|nr:MAG: glycerol-3-phosphate dehydrogenase [Rhodospirillales bacterium]